MKTILISCLVLNGSRSGYRRIIENLINHFLESPARYRFVFILQRSGYESLEIPSRNFPDWLKIIIVPDIPNKWLRVLFEQLYVPFIALKLNIHSIFMPATFGLFLPVKRVVTFIHTNTHFEVDKHLRGRGRLQQLSHQLLSFVTRWTSKKLVFTSDKTHAEYSKYFAHDFPKIILGNGLRQGEIVHTKNTNDEIKPFILSVSQIYRLKNFSTLIKGFILAKQSMALPRDCNLVIVGTVQETTYLSELKYLAKDRDDIFFKHDISNTELAELYNNCEFYAFFSLFEGFSLTPGEAFLAGKRFALSDIPTHREIYGDAAFYADPSSVDELAQSLEAAYRERFAPLSLEQHDRLTELLSFTSFVEKFEDLFDEI